MSSTKRHQKSQRKNSSAKPYNEPLPAPSFLFSVTELPVNWEFRQRNQPETNQWIPPISKEGFCPPLQETRHLYRFTGDGSMSSAGNNYTWADGRWNYSVGGFTQALTIFRATSTFWCNPIFMTSTCDPTIYDMKDEDAPNNRWWPLTFELHGTTARVQESAERSLLRGVGNRWIEDLGLTGYLRYSSSVQTSELTGKIGTIIGLVALSCPAGQLYTALLGDFAWYYGIWRGHQQGPGRDADPRGVVVTIYLDPENQGSTEQILHAIEASGGSLLRENAN